MIKRFEGLYLTPYLCPAGVATCGYGATSYESGQKVRLSDPPISKARAEQLLIWSINNQYLPAVIKLCPRVTDPNRLVALIDFTFNLGKGNLQASTLRKCVNRGDWDGAKLQIRRWNKANGRVLRGLTLRREAEAVLL
jgi:lysozyme